MSLGIIKVELDRSIAVRETSNDFGTCHEEPTSCCLATTLVIKIAGSINSRRLDSDHYLSPGCVTWISTQEIECVELFYIGLRIDADKKLHFFHQAFFQGKIKIKGNMGLAMKLKEIQPKPGKSKL